MRSSNSKIKFNHLNLNKKNLSSKRPKNFPNLLSKIKNLSIINYYNTKVQRKSCTTVQNQFKVKLKKIGAKKSNFIYPSSFLKQEQNTNENKPIELMYNELEDLPFEKKIQYIKNNDYLLNLILPFIFNSNENQ